MANLPEFPDGLTLFTKAEYLARKRIVAGLKAESDRLRSLDKSHNDARAAEAAASHKEKALAFNRQTIEQMWRGLGHEPMRCPMLVSPGLYAFCREQSAKTERYVAEKRAREEKG